jgi:uncharacterized protein (TIGR02145 family)
MKYLRVYFIFFFISGISLAQSKKEMIAILTNRVDSLNQIVVDERSIVLSERADKQILNTEISILKKQIKELERNNENLSNDKSSLDTQNNTLNKELQENQGQIVELNKQLKIKQDSLVLVTTELLKYRPAPKPVIVVKQDNTGPIKTVTIGTQVWMKENLNVSTFKNGVAIPEVQDNDAWKKAGKNKQPAWCYYDNDPKNGAKFGKLYNWYAVIDNNGLCPQGWYVPSDAEWDTLIAYLGGSDVAGAKMKAKPVMKKGVDYYDVDTKDCSNCANASKEYKKICPVCKGTGRIKIPLRKEKYVYDASGFKGGTNESGFTGLPGGYRDCDYVGDCNSIGANGSWWSSTEDGTSAAWYRYLNGNGGGAYRYVSKENGFSVRCLRD